jgi:hypothetical protein
VSSWRHALWWSESGKSARRRLKRAVMATSESTCADRSTCDSMYHWANVVIHTCWIWTVNIQHFAHSGDTYRIHTDTCNTYTYLQIHTHTYTRQSVPGGSFQALLQPIENPLECTGYRDQLRGGLRQDCRARKTYDMPMGGAKGALWTPQRSAYAHLECICTSSIFYTHTNRYTQIHTHTTYIHTHMHCPWNTCTYIRYRLPNT